MKIIRKFKDAKTGIEMAQVSFAIPFETADLIPAVAKLEGYDPDYLAFYAIINYMGAYEGHPCDDQPSEEEMKAYGIEVATPAAGA